MGWKNSAVCDRSAGGQRKSELALAANSLAVLGDDLVKLSCGFSPGNSIDLAKILEYCQSLFARNQT